MNRESDERLSRADRDSRLLEEREKRGRESSERTTTEDRVLNDGERLAMLRASHWQEALPNLPHRDGYHEVWLTTANPRDPIHGRLRLGYELMKAAEEPGFEHTALNSGSYPGVITVNEMVAARIPLTLYKAYMTDVHHTQPNAEEERLNAVVDSIRENAERAGAKVEMGDGTAEMMNSKPRNALFEGV